MLAQTVRSNLTDIKSLKMRSKTTKFSSLFQTAPTAGVQEPEIKQVLMKDGLIEISEEDSLFDDISVEDSLNSEQIKESFSDEENDEISEYIVENPDEVVVQFPIISDIQLEENLPFFRSLSLKLANL